MGWALADEGPALVPQATPQVLYSLIISNEAPGRLVDYLIAQGHGNDTLFQVLGYLKAQPGGVISDAWYNQVAADAHAVAYAAAVHNTHSHGNRHSEAARVPAAPSEVTTDRFTP